MASNVLIRNAVQSDCPGIAALIMELAVFEKMPEEVKLTAEDLVRDGFTLSPPLFRCFVAEEENKLIGMALYYLKYSTWKGKSMCLEDLCVTADSRNRTVGSLLFEAVVKTALDENCYRLDFEVLSWNRARRFYNLKGAVDITESEDWHLYRMERKQLEDLLAKVNKQ